MIRWRTTYGESKPIAFECNDSRDRDDLGRKQYDNTHFDTIAEAWERLLAETKAGLSLSAGRLRDLRKTIAGATQECADAGLVLDAVLKAHEDWEEAK